MVDTLETAAAFGLRVRPEAGRNAALEMDIDFDPFRQDNFDALIAGWLPLTYAVNGLNHSMGSKTYTPLSWRRRSWASSVSSTGSSTETVTQTDLRRQSLISWPGHDGHLADEIDVSFIFRIAGRVDLNSRTTVNSS